MKWISRFRFPILLLMTMAFFSCSDKRPVFTLLENAAIGVAFENNLTYTEEFNAYLFRNFYNGAGVGLADLTNDGNLDLFLCGNQVDNKLYIGDGNFNFQDITDHAGVASAGSWTTGVSIVDVNQDGWKDIYVCKSGRLEDPNRRNELFIHNGLDEHGLPTFTESAKKYGIDDLGFSIHAVFVDYDRDGDLDMYLSNNSHNPTEVVIDAKKGMRDKREPDGNKLYRNEGDYFKDVTIEAGIYSSAIGYGLGISVADVNRDGWPDIYVANDFFEKDYLYINQGDGTFKESIAQWTSEISLGSMGVDISDMNHDGFPEIFVTEMLPEDEGRLKTKAVFDSWDKYALKIENGYHRQFPRNTFQYNNGRDPVGSGVHFSEISRYAGVAASDWSWGAQMIDLDHDGHKEIFITNGVGKDLLDHDYLDFYDNPARLRQILKDKGEVMTELLDHMPSQAIANHLYKVDSNLVFTNVASEFGLAQPGFSSGSAYGDIDNDGDLDLVVNNINSPPFIYRNDLATEKNHYIILSLKKRNGTTAVGAQVSLRAGGKLYYEELYPMRGVMSVVDDRLQVGLGQSTLIDSLEIMWPDGSKQVEKNLSVDQFLTITQGVEPGETGIIDGEETIRSTFPDDSKSYGLDFVHKESPFVDFDKDRLLFNMVSNEGPKVAVADVNGDGLDDCYIGGAKGEPGALFIQHGTTFHRTNVALLESDRNSEDQQAIFFDADNDGDKDLLVSSGSYEFSSSSFALHDRLYLNNGKGEFTKSDQVLPSVRPTSTSVVIHEDYDKDGDEDLFFGSRFVPGLYGVPASSYLLENNGRGQFTNVTETKAPGLIELGMVTDAVWTDFDGDDDPDLVIVGEWMPVRLFANQRGIFKELQTVEGLEHSHGFWNTIEVSDLDNDGDEDFIIGNMGYNTFFKASQDKPAEMYVNDFDRNGSIEHMFTTYRENTSYPVVLKDEITKQMPHLRKKYLKHSAYQRQTMNDIFTEDEREGVLSYKVFETGSCIFWNEREKFIKQNLPFEAQWAPVFSIYPADIDNNGHIDIVLGGNQYCAKPQTGIYAGSYGVIISNEGNRKFKHVDPKTSGFKVMGQIRDMQKISIGNVDHLLIARNNDSLKIIRFK